MNLGPSALVGFLARAALVNVLLLAPWPGLHEAYGGFYRFGVNQLGRLLDLDERVWAWPAEGGGQRYDSTILTRHEVTGRTRMFPLSTRYFPYMATALLIALVVATPTEWRHRCKALLIALVVMNAWLALEMAAHLTLSFRWDPLPWFPGTGFERKVLSAISFAPWYGAPVLIWIALLGRPLYRALFDGRGAGSQSALQPLRDQNTAAGTRAADTR